MPVELVRVRDGDTLVVRRKGSDLEWPVRLLDCWAEEKHTAGGREAKAYLEATIANEELSLFVPFDGIERTVMDLFTPGS